ncbi:MAG TPA: DNA ligase D, partial [Sphingomonas sp.]|nr:DNA ligase D [Sphingomonas sp.]
GTDTLVDEGLTSVATGRTMAEIAEGKPAPKRKATKRSRTPPPFRDPQLCTLVDAVPPGNAWMHEVKYDGYRALVSVGGGKAKVFTRSGLDWTDKFSAIADAAAALPVENALIDGEIVAFKDGKPDFSTLKNAIAGGGDMILFAFDLLELNGEDLKALPNVQRKERLRPLIGDGPRIRFAEHVVGAGEALFATMCREGLEGVVSKRADAPYSGKRSKDWLKTKCIQRQEFVIVGWMASEKSRGLRSLLLGVHEDGRLRYAGKVGTGFDHATMDDLAQRLAKLERKTATVEAPRAAVRGAHWVKPELVAEVAFAEVTPDGVLRHSSFIGLRADKAAADVVAEAPQPVAPTPKIEAKVSSRERVIFPESDLTKGDLADYVVQVAPLILPWTANRPVSLVRCPQGRARACFFQKHDAGSFGDAVHHVDVREKDGSVEPYLYVADTEGLVACVQMGSIEFHGWGSSVAALEKPDRMVFDLDPDEGLDFEETKKAAEYLKGQLAELGLVSFPMLSGGKGVHVVVPLKPDAEWPAVKNFADRFAQAMAQADPDRFVAVMSKAKRKGRIFIDWLRNQRGATAIMPYSARARANAPVAAPVTWTELRDIDTAARWTIRDGDELIARANSRALSGWGVADQVLPDV